jgi:hypothetical protein
MDQSEHSDSAGRKVPELVLFGIGFVGFLVAATGIEIGSPGLALAGGIILLLAIWPFSI